MIPGSLERHNLTFVTYHFILVSWAAAANYQNQMAAIAQPGYTMTVWSMS